MELVITRIKWPYKWVSLGFFHPEISGVISPYNWFLGPPSRELVVLSDGQAIAWSPHQHGLSLGTDFGGLENPGPKSKHLRSEYLPHVLQV